MFNYLYYKVQIFCLNIQIKYYEFMNSYYDYRIKKLENEMYK